MGSNELCMRKVKMKMDGVRRKKIGIGCVHEGIEDDEGVEGGELGKK